MEKKNKIILALTYSSVLLFLILIGSGNVITPFFGELNLIDEGQFAGWMLHMFHGGHLYKDTYAAYGPFYIYPLYLIMKIAGLTFFNIRIYYVVLSFFSVIIAGLVLNKLRIRMVIQLLAVFFLVYIPGFGLRQAMGLLTILISYISFEKNKLRWCFLSGFLLGATFLTSSDIGIFTTATLVVLFSIKFFTEKYLNFFFKRVFIMIIGLMTIFSIFFIWSNSEGWFYSYTSSIIDDLISYSGIGIVIGQKFPNALTLFPNYISIIGWIKFTLSKDILFYWVFIFYLITFIYFFLKIMIKKINKKDFLVLLISIYGFLISTILIGRLGNFTFVLPQIFILLAYFLDGLTDLYKKSHNRSDKYFGLILSLVILIFLFRLVTIYRTHLKAIPQALASVYQKKDSASNVGEIKIPREQENDIKQIQKFVWTSTRPNEKIFFLSNNPGLYFLVDRIDPSRFDLPEVANTKEKRMEIISDLEKDKTKYVIDYEKAYKVDGISNQVRLPEITEYIDKNYSKSQFNDFVIYTRKNRD